ncbi:MAG: hypothetical protein HZC41_22840 [Chloroflexi bacterium]|nr:hypothetical protein [Chloroflexota bacterium]
MADISFEEVAQLAEKLTKEEQAALIERLQQRVHPRRSGLTQEQVLAEFERRKANGEFENAESLYGKFAHPATDLADDSLLKTIHEIATEWEQELDEFFGDDKSA